MNDRMIISNADQTGLYRDAATGESRSVWGIFAETGTGVDGLFTAEEVIAKADLGWKVTLDRVMNGRTRRVIPGRFCVTREDNGAHFGEVSSSYVPWQNIDAIEWLDRLVGEKVISYSTAGYWDNGKTVWLLVDIQRQFEPLPGDQVKLYLLVSFGHGGSAAARIGLQPIRVVCGNTHRAAVDNIREGAYAAKSLAIRHSGNMEKRLEKGMELIRGQINLIAGWQDEVAAMVNEAFNEEEAEQAVIDIVQAASVERGTQERVTTIGELNYRQAPIALKMTELLYSGKGMDIPGVKGTGWQVFNAATEWVDHYSNEDANARAMYSMFGRGSLIKDYASRIATRQLSLA